MNNYPHLLEVDASFNKELCKQVWHTVERRFKAGPFVVVERREHSRYVCIAKSKDGKLQIWENGGGLTPGPSVLCKHLAETLPQFALTDVNQLHPGESPSWWQIRKRAYYALDTKLQHQMYNEFVESLPEWLSKLFPLIRTDGKAKLDLLTSHVELPKENYSVDCFRYHCYLKARLQLSVESEHETPSTLKKQIVTIANFPALTPDCSFVHRGTHKRYAVDDFSQQLCSLLRQYIDKVQLRLDGTPLGTLASLTPYKLYNQDE